MADMTTPLRPRTAAGRRMAESVRSYVPDFGRVVPDILAIEAEAWKQGIEATQDERAEAAPDLRAALERVIHADICDGSQSHHHGDCKGMAERYASAISAPPQPTEHLTSGHRAQIREAAALAAPAADGLDVERLARAILHSGFLTHTDPLFRKGEAQKIAAAYLREPSREPGEEG